MRKKDVNITKEIELFLNRNPYVRTSLEQEIVNYSALSRKITKEIGDVNFEAVKSTLIRTAKKYRKNVKDRDKKIIDLLNKSNFKIENKISTIHHISPLDIESVAYSKTPNGYMYFVNEKIAKKSKYKNIDYGFATIHITSPRYIEETFGVAAFLLSTLSAQGINVVHMLDCREDTFIVVKEEDAPIAFKTLAETLRLYSDR